MLDLMTTPLIPFAYLTRQQVSQQFGQIYITSTDRFGLAWKTRCPNPKCRRKAFVISEQLREGHCFVCGHTVEGIKGQGVAVYNDTPRHEEVQPISPPTVDDPLYFPIDTPQSAQAREYLLQRGIYHYALYQLKYCTMGMFAGRIIIPVYCDQHLVGIQGRTIFEGVEPKYLFARGFRKTEYLYGFDFAKSSKVVIIVEGVFDAMKGYPYAVATFGAGISDAQLKLLATHWSKCIFIPDSDEAGQIGTIRAITWLSKYIKVGVFPLQGYHDFGDVPFSKAQSIVRELQNW